MTGIFPPTSLLDGLVAAHVVYNHFRQDIHSFSQLISHMASVLIELRDSSITFSPTTFELHLNAVIVALEDVESPLHRKDATKAHLDEWILKWKKCQNCIESILCMTKEGPKVDKAK